MLYNCRVQRWLPLRTVKQPQAQTLDGQQLQSTVLHCFTVVTWMCFVQVLPSLSDCISAMNKVRLHTKCSLSCVSGCGSMIRCNDSMLMLNMTGLSAVCNAMATDGGPAS